MPKKKSMILVAGPCSAESEEQLRSTASQLKKNGKVSFFRAGLWKPRSQPGSFEGVGDRGINWMVRIQKDYSLPIISEVANPSHVEKALKAGFDALWIGARTTVNPFYVQEIADALKGVKVPVFVKNPVNPDLKLWLGGLERIEGSTSHTVFPLHRGFSLSGNSRFRNSPQWQLPIELHTLRPDLTLVCDPSHIAGHKQYLLEIAQKALDLNYGGLMIETHFRPETALSDSKQQITPSELSSLLSKLLQRKNVEPEGHVLEDLNRQRTVIDECDTELLRLLSRRMSVSQAIGELKFEHQLSVLQPERWKSILEKALSSGRKLGLSEDFVDQLFKAIHDESIDQQTFLRNREEAE